MNVNSLELPNQIKRYDKFHIIHIASKSQVTLIKFEDNNYVFDVDNEKVNVRKDERNRLIVDCHCKDCAYYNIKRKNILCRRQLALYKYLFDNKGYIQEKNVQEEIELNLP